MSESFSLTAEWKVNTPGLLKEVLCNPGAEMLEKPLSILGHILAEVAEAAIRIDDPELNHLMCRLALYSVGDPYDKDFDQKVVDQVKNLAAEAAQKRVSK